MAVAQTLVLGPVDSTDRVVKRELTIIIGAFRKTFELEPSTREFVVKLREGTEFSAELVDIDSVGKRSPIVSTPVTIADAKAPLPSTLEVGPQGEISEDDPDILDPNPTKPEPSDGGSEGEGPTGSEGA